MPSAKQTDEYLEKIMKNKNVSLGQDDNSEIVQDLVEMYQAAPLSASMKQRIWQASQVEGVQVMRQKRDYSIWAGGLVAGVVFLIGILFVLIYPQVNEAMFAAPPASLPETATEIILDPENLIFSDAPNVSDAFGFEYGGYATLDNDMPMAAMMHENEMTWVARYISYQPDIDLAEIEADIVTAHEQGFKIMLSVEGYYHRFDLESGLDSYTDFLAQVAALNPDAIEIWKQANIDRSMPQDYLGAEHFAIILERASAAIRDVNPQILIISGAPAPTGAEDAFPRQVINDDNFLQQLMDLGALETVDCVGMNYNEGIVSPLAIEGDMRDNYYTRYLPTMLQRYREVVDAEIPICITSLAYLSWEGIDEIPEFFQWAENTSRAEQEQWTSEALEWLSLQYDVPLVIIFHLDDDDYPDEFALDDAYSLIFTGE